MKIKKPLRIAVCGSASGKISALFEKKAFQVGEAIAENNCVLCTGATFGYSYKAVKGAVNKKGVVIGFSGAESQRDHQKRFEKIDFNLFTHIIYSGLGYKMRDVLMFRNVDGAVYIGGGVGTLLEMSLAPDYQAVMGILKGSGGATEVIEIIRKISHRFKPAVVIDDNPRALVEKIIKIIKSR